MHDEPAFDPAAGPASTPGLLAVCLCAGWCRLCDSYEATWEAAEAEWPGVAFRWIDIEDEADLLGDVDVEDFPTLLIVRDGEVRFFGTALPHADTLRRLLRSAQDAPPVPVEAEVTRLACQLVQEAQLGFSAPHHPSPAA
ncbi:thioredoxin domain-containing protein [Eleftheria terrae]|uniref:thioredoxin domain-containing protein n=1 Tax=Eleftheria terrae TaxID=1597781 RepID=UPI00263BE22B|nr:thioredoxin domain-containing protein [Eleftheria terrae]WKB54689.1 thioredoxin domain-containing protein [Eleftheria terrae]